MEHPLLSVVIPVYNDEAYLRQCLDSAAAQSLHEIEIVCVNDCSTDGTADILEEYAKKDRRFVLLHKKKNEGCFMARKDGVKAASAPYIMFLDADDALADNCCETAYKLMREHSADIVWFSYDIVDLPDSKASFRVSPTFENAAVELADCRKKIQLNRRNWTSMFAKLYRTELLKAANAAADDFYCSYGEDVYASYFIFLFAKRIYCSSESLYVYYKWRGMSARSRVGLTAYRARCQMSDLCRRLRSYLEREGLFDSERLFWEDMTRRLAVDCCIYYESLSPEDYDAAGEIFRDSWDGLIGAEELLQQLSVLLAEQRKWSVELETAKQWLLGQVESKDARIAELEAWTTELEKAKTYFSKQIESKDRRIAELEAWTSELEKAKEWFIEQLKNYSFDFSASEDQGEQTEAVADNADNGKFDHIISLGYNCEVSFRIKDYTHSEIESYPFSWVYILDQIQMAQIMDTFYATANRLKLTYRPESGMFYSPDLNMSFHTKEEKVSSDSPKYKLFLSQASEEINSRFRHLSDKWKNLLKGDGSSLFIMKLQGWQGAEKCGEIALSVNNWLQKNYRNANYLLACITDSSEVYDYLRYSVIPKSPNLAVTKIVKFAEDSDTRDGGDINGWINAIHHWDHSSPSTLPYYNTNG